MDTLFFGISVPIYTADCTKMVLFSVWWAGRKAVAVVGKQVPSFKCQVQEDWSGVDWSGFEDMSKFTVLPSRPRRQINGVLYMLGGNVCNSIRCFYRRIFRYIHEMSTRSRICLLSCPVSSCIVGKGYVLLDTYTPRYLT